MKELTAVFQSEVFRPVVCLIVPGFYATSMPCIAFWQRFPNLRALVDGHPGSTAIVLLLIMLTLGLMTEDWGARIEHFLDLRLERKAGHANDKQEWFEYLRIVFDKEPIGQRYLRSIVLRMKFELGMAVGSPLFVLGTLFIEAASWWRFGICLGGATLMIYFLIEAHTSNEVLCEIRHELLKKQWS